MLKTTLLISCLIMVGSCGNSSGDDGSPGIKSYSFSERAFPDDNIWNQDISAEPVDPKSEIYITSLGKTGNLVPDFGTVWEGAPMGTPFVVVDSNQPKVDVTFEYVSSSDPGPYPIPADAPIQGGPDSTGDRHVIVVDKDNGLLYELYSAYPNPDGSWKAVSGAVFDLNSNTPRPDNWTSADAAGLPIFPRTGSL